MKEKRTRNAKEGTTRVRNVSKKKLGCTGTAGNAGSSILTVQNKIRPIATVHTATKEQHENVIYNIVNMKTSDSNGLHGVKNNENEVQGLFEPERALQEYRVDGIVRHISLTANPKYFTRLYRCTSANYRDPPGNITDHFISRYLNQKWGKMGDKNGQDAIEKTVCNNRKSRE